MIALYKINSPLAEKIADILYKFDQKPTFYYSKNSLLDQIMNPLVLITSCSYIEEVETLHVPIVPLSINLSDVEKVIQEENLYSNKWIIVASKQEIEWLKLEKNLSLKDHFQFIVKDNLSQDNIQKNSIFFVSAWENNFLFPPYLEKNIRYVEPSIATITSAVRQALSLISITRDMLREKYQVEAVVNSAHDGIIAVDRSGHITLTNENAKHFLGLEGEVIGRKITDYIPHSDMVRVLQTGKKEIGDIAKIFDRQMVINRFPIIISDKVVGAVSNFKEITEIQKLEMKVRKKLHHSGLEAKYRLMDIIGNSVEVSDVKQQAKLFAETNATVLITGESGTGKELFAQGIHLESNRAVCPFVAVNCAAFPESLLESELFGYEEGSFTGAQKGGKQGVFELAHGGTLFLDEIGEMPLRIQTILLRVLQEKSIRRIGGNRTIPLDVRIIAATNRNLDEEVEQKRFRSDLYYRINVLTLELPPLRRRIQDIPLLVQSMIAQFNEEREKKIETLEEDVYPFLMSYHWPGNIRELRNIIERMVLLNNGPKLSISQSPFLQKLQRKNYQDLKENQLSLKQGEKELIQYALNKYSNKTMAAKSLGIDRSTLWRKIKEYNL
ncbi:sigma-54 interaction domain-containing protein [Psychrobacillus soli]|uniref:PAS domain-containing protein n=1 Tax=Psychrobacillus soli TaxID=1543965 RepID=A0A544SRJ4_9BACI|nr:sigma 54-interacting transcriptional regulator [Psychrobacillus soli]TQR07788.1 PAS domain-containing protein [Psychrobacillus soli]